MSGNTEQKAESRKEDVKPMYFIVAVIIGFIRGIFGRGNKY